MLAAPRTGPYGIASGLTTINSSMATPNVGIRPEALANYADGLPPAVVQALHELAPLDDDRQALMAARLERRARRAQDKERIAFLDPASRIGRTSITVA